MRLNRFLAHCGVGSRRKSDELIFNGHVKVNGKVVKEPWIEISQNKDVVEVYGKKINIEEKIYIALNKPKGVITTLKDDFNRKIITELVKGVSKRIYPVGRLDYDVSGIILLTNDGELANRLIHPKFKVAKTYIVKIKRNISFNKLKKLEKGIILDDGHKTLPAKCSLIKHGEGFSIVKLQIKEGKKRQVKRMFKALNHPVIELKRVEFASISVGKLKEGEWRYLSKDEVKKLYEIARL